MKFSITPVAVAVTMALGAAVAQAQVLPSIGTTSPADGIKNDGLYLAVWDDSTQATDLVDLTATYAQISLTKSTSMITPTPGSNGWSTVSNFDGYSSVDQLNLGSISNFSSIFPANSISSTTNYVVLAGNTSGEQALASAPLGNPQFVTQPAIADYDNAIRGESANWTSASTSSPLSDTTGTAAYSVIAGPLKDGNLGVTGTSFGVNVGTAAGFYSYVANNGVSATPYDYNGQQGFWFLSSTGDLSWNLVASTVSSVPLPAAVWLFASGLIGLGLIGRRRQTGFGATV